LTVVKPGTQKRYFTHIDDIVEGLILVAENGYGDEFGIGCAESYTILEIAKLFGGKIEFIPEKKGNRMDSDFFTKKTEALGWVCKHSIKDYINDFLKAVN